MGGEKGVVLPLARKSVIGTMQLGLIGICKHGGSDRW